MTWYRYWQATPDSAWNACPSGEYKEVQARERPPFSTVLELDCVVDDYFQKEDFAKIKYRGDFYADFDGESLEEVIPQAQKFVEKILEKGVDPQDLEIAATGGRGFHVIVPMRCFIRKPNSAGYQYLPQIYKEMAYNLYVDTLDMRVYSARKGRMWRNYGVARPNGKYKVWVPYEVFVKLTPETYLETVTSPNAPPPQRKEVAYSGPMGALFQASSDKVEQGSKRKAKKVGGSLEGFKGLAPPTLARIMAGEVLKPDAGFQKVAMQLAICAHELGWELKRFLGACEGLISKHQSDGSRYNTPDKRRRELSRMYDYMEGNPCYDYGAGAIIDMVEPSHDARDLKPKIGPDAQEEGELDESELDPLCEGFIVRKTGIWQKKWNKDTGEEELMLVTNMGFSKVTELANHESGRVVGYEVSVHVPNRAPSTELINLNDFETKTAFRRATGSATHLKVADTHVGGLQNVFSRMAEKGGRLVYSVPTEGINVFKRPKDRQDPNGQSNFWVWYISRNDAFYYPEEGETNVDKAYRLDPFIELNQGQGRSDLADAPFMKDTVESRKVLDILFGSYPAPVLAKVLGWHTAAFLCPFLRYHWGQFPLLQCYGTAGSGKTSLNAICAHLHTYLLRPTLISTPHVTEFAMTAPLASSASIPVIYDEVKFREMHRAKSDLFKSLLRNNYNGNSGSKGSVSRGAGKSNLALVELPNIAPMAFMAEAQLDQEAILHRSVLVDFPHVQKTNDKRSLDFMWLKSHATVLSGLGRIILERVMHLHVEQLPGVFQQIQEPIMLKAPNLDARSSYNLAVIVLGLDVLDSALESVFDNRYKSRIQDLRAAITDDPKTHTRTNMSETARVLNSLAWLSARSVEDFIRLEYEKDWRYDDASMQTIELHPRNCWDVYSRYCRSIGSDPLFDTETAFIDALNRHPAVLDRFCPDSPLKRGRLIQVLRFDLNALYEEGVEQFNLGS